VTGNFQAFVAVKTNAASSVTGDSIGAFFSQSGTNSASRADPSPRGKVDALRFRALFEHVNIFRGEFWFDAGRVVLRHQRERCSAQAAPPTGATIKTSASSRSRSGVTLASFGIFSWTPLGFPRCLAQPAHAHPVDGRIRIRPIVETLAALFSMPAAMTSLSKREARIEVP